MRKLVLISLLLYETASGGFEHRDAGGRSAALGGAYTAVGGDVWVLWYNPAGLSRLSAREVSFGYSPAPYGITEISHAAAALSLPAAGGTVGVSATRYGFDLYREISAAFTYARQVADVALGISCIYYHAGIQHYGAAGTFGIDAGVLFFILPGLSGGLALRNINAPTVGAGDEKLLQAFSFGVAYTPSSSLTIALDGRKEGSFDAGPRLGFEYRPVDAVALRCGLSDEPSQVCGGLGVRPGSAELDYAFLFHPDLGWTHQASVTLRW